MNQLSWQLMPPYQSFPECHCACGLREHDRLQSLAQTNVSFFYLNPLLQVEFRAIFESFSYINFSKLAQNAMKYMYCHVCKSQMSGQPVA